MTEDYRLDDFAYGVDSIDDWLKRRALPDQVNGASRTYVVTEEKRVVGYYCLASGGLELSDTPALIRRNMPDPVPVAIFGRLAVDKPCQDKGLGIALLQDAAIRWEHLSIQPVFKSGQHVHPFM